MFVIRPDASGIGSFCEFKIKHKKVCVLGDAVKPRPAPSICARHSLQVVLMQETKAVGT